MVLFIVALILTVFVWAVADKFLCAADLNNDGFFYNLYFRIVYTFLKLVKWALTICTVWLGISAI